MHSHPGVTAANAPPANTNHPTHTTSTAPNRDALRAPITTPLSAPRTNQLRNGATNTKIPRNPPRPTWTRTRARTTPTLHPPPQHHNTPHPASPAQHNDTRHTPHHP